ncbi:hypothetical protein OC846_003322 [Tilletia horrida]|uniref:Uncharacterized protein n=1 Tax=Tilletia horrida TaxID=155126 RepID=A0AAN6JRU6_9BASI|nr:hypothetical protein OC846_003322 [Tilletia horrida]KAK0568623.1 hypothetical protein OC861_001785 [Tilletia horrida]
MVNLPLSSLRHITALRFDVCPTSSLPAARSLRLLLASLPSKPPAPKAGSAPVTLPTLETKLVGNQDLMSLHVTYSDKKTIQWKLGTGQNRSIDLKTLLEKVEAPARALRLKEDGL